MTPDPWWSTLYLAHRPNVHRYGAGIIYRRPCGVSELLWGAIRMALASFVDAGYLYAAGSIVLTGSRQSQNYLDLDIGGTIQNLLSVGKAQAPSTTALRVYWYDGLRQGRMSKHQLEVADSDNVKLRLGFVNAQNQQKGVDSLIVTDLIELARNHAITDAVLLSGDEDLRVGVQIAQSFGVRVHLVGIEPSRGNQSMLLRQEADTKTEWTKSDISKILKYNTSNVVWSAYAPPVTPGGVDNPEALDQAVDRVIASLGPEVLANVSELMPNEGVPREYDRLLLSEGVKAKNGDQLTDAEKRYLRQKLKEKAISP